MARSSTALRLDQLPEGRRQPGRIVSGGGGPPGQPPRPHAPAIDNARLATVMLLGAETMFFAGLIGAFIVFRIGAPVWPPPFQPRLPVGVTAVNTLILLLSAVTMLRGLKAIRSNDRAGTTRWLATTALLGGVFLAVQGFEWLRLVHFGLTVSSSIYGGLFYTLIGFHALHVVGALVWLLAVLWRASRGGFSKERHTGLVTCSMYWIFVVALWPVLYGLVYLY